MTTGLEGLLERNRVPGGRVVWLDCLAYARRLFSPGEDVWGATASYVGLARQAQHLLGSDVIEVRLGDFHRAALARDPALADAFRGGRAPRALRRLLEEQQPAQTAVEAVSALHGLFPGRAIVLVVDSGGTWLRWAADVSDGTWTGDPDDVDRAAVYLADTVRAFASAGVSGLALDVLGDDPAAPEELVELHRPLLNLAEHYHWSTVLRIGERQLSGITTLKSVDVVLCPEASFSTATEFVGSPSFGGGLTADFWNSADVPEARGSSRILAYGEIPEDAYPEDVLSRLAALRLPS